MKPSGALSDEIDFGSTVTFTLDFVASAGSNCSCASNFVNRAVQCEKLRWFTRNSSEACGLSPVYAPAGAGAVEADGTAAAAGLSAARPPEATRNAGAS